MLQWRNGKFLGRRFDSATTSNNAPHFKRIYMQCFRIDKKKKKKNSWILTNDQCDHFERTCRSFDARSSAMQTPFNHEINSAICWRAVCIGPLINWRVSRPQSRSNYIGSRLLGPTTTTCLANVVKLLELLLSCSCLGYTYLYVIHL